MRLIPIFIIGLLIGDILSLIWLGSQFGVLATLLVLACDIILGISLIRQTGQKISTFIKTPAHTVQLQSGQALTSVLRILAGGLFILPGILSDILALLFMLPFTAPFILYYFRKLPVFYQSNTANAQATGQKPAKQGLIIEGEVISAQDTLKPQP